MIMPCMKSTSAWERGGSVPFVEGGSVLLGLRGAPGWMRTGAGESFCCARAGEEQKPARSMEKNAMEPLREWKLRMLREAKGTRCSGQQIIRPLRVFVASSRFWRITKHRIYIMAAGIFHWKWQRESRGR